MLDDISNHGQPWGFAVLHSVPDVIVNRQTPLTGTRVVNSASLVLPLYYSCTTCFCCFTPLLAAFKPTVLSGIKSQNTGWFILVKHTLARFVYPSVLLHFITLGSVSLEILVWQFWCHCSIVLNHLVQRITIRKPDSLQNFGLSSRDMLTVLKIQLTVNSNN